MNINDAERYWETSPRWAKVLFCKELFSSKICSAMYWICFSDVSLEHWLQKLLLMWWNRNASRIFLRFPSQLYMKFSRVFTHYRRREILANFYRRFNSTMANDLKKSVSKYEFFMSSQLPLQNFFALGKMSSSVQMSEWLCEREDFNPLRLFFLPVRSDEKIGWKRWA